MFHHVSCCFLVFLVVLRYVLNHKPPWNMLKQTVTYLNISKYTGNNLKHHVTCWKIPKHVEAYWNIMKHIETYWNAKKHQETCGNYLDLLKYTETYWNHHETQRNTLMYVSVCFSMFNGVSWWFQYASICFGLFRYVFMCFGFFRHIWWGPTDRPSSLPPVCSSKPTNVRRPSVQPSFQPKENIKNENTANEYTENESTGND